VINAPVFIGQFAPAIKAVIQIDFFRVL